MHTVEIFYKGLAYSSLAILSFGVGVRHADAQQSPPTIRHHRVAEPSPETTTSPEVVQAEAAIQRSDYNQAEALLLEAVAAKDDDYRAWFDLGFVYNALQRAPDAIAAYRKAVATKPDVFESNLNLGLLLAKQGDNAEAAKYLKAATQLKPEAHPQEALARAWQALGRIQQGSDPQSALVAYAEAGKLAPSDPGPHVAAAQLLQQQKDLDGAAREYQAALQLDGRSQEALSGLASVDIAGKNYDEAEQVLRKIVAANPQDAPAHVQLARVLSAEGKNGEAAEQLKIAQQTDAGDPHAALELGTLQVKAGKDAEAEQNFRLAVQKLPNDPEPHFALGSLLMYEKKFPEAQQELLAALKLKPDMAEAYGNLAIVAASNKQYEMTLRALDDRAKYLPEIPATVFLRATTYDNLKDIPQAVEYYQHFLAVDGGKFPDQEWQARHRLIALDPKHADNYRVKK
ncbi:MAG TPA: tetratricopeptide repeat protein [Terriglobales bacterium]|nr:tetratricopeptide repeat protein [Terriglobales bacterium]